MATSLVHSLFTGSEESNRILLQDTVDQNARPLLKCCMCHLTKRFSVVHLFLVEMDLHRWSLGMPQEVMEKVVVHDGFSDLLGWSTSVKKQSSQFHLHDCTAQSFIDSLGGKSQREDRAVVVDSISSLLLHQSATAICRIIHTLGEYCSLLVCLVHADLHQDHVISQFCHVTSTSMLVQSDDLSSTAAAHSGGCGLCAVTHRRKSGKVLRKLEEYTVSQSFTALSASTQDGRLHSTAAATTGRDTTATEEPDPTANLTFDLRLSSKEKEDRSRVVLPYTSVRDAGVGVVSSASQSHASKGSGQIYYQPDDVDDFDESDPDDDLDI